jgi:hypothetical protein
LKAAGEIRSKHGLAEMALVAAALGGCGSSNNHGGQSNFTGTIWTGTETTTTLCGSDGLTTSFNAWTVAFAAQGSGIAFASAAGCTFDFSVSGDTATLSNGPVVCSNTSSAAAGTGPPVSTEGGEGPVAPEQLPEEASFMTYTVTSTDGRHLTAIANGTVMQGGTTCLGTITFTDAITATR